MLFALRAGFFAALPGFSAFVALAGFALGAALGFLGEDLAEVLGAAFRAAARPRAGRRPPPSATRWARSAKRTSAWSNVNESGDASLGKDALVVPSVT